MTEKQVAKLIEQTACEALFNGAGKIINREIFMEAARAIKAALEAQPALRRGNA